MNIIQTISPIKFAQTTINRAVNFNAHRIIADDCDSFELREKSSKTVEDFVPDVFKGSDVPMHHELNGCNHAVRIAVEYENKKLPDKDKNWYISTIEIGKITMQEADEAFKKLKPLEKDCIVYRGRAENPIFKSSNKDFEIIDKANIGDIIVPDTAYSYAAFHKSLAQNWGGTGARAYYSDGETPKRVMMMKILLPKGAKVSRNLEHGGEVVMPRSAKYELLSKEITNEFGDLKVVLRYIP